MVSEISDEYEFIILWKIENYHCCWQKNKGLYSSVFIATSMENTKWCLSLYPSDNNYENYIRFYLDLQDDGESLDVDFILEILGREGSVLIQRYTDKQEFSKDDKWGYPSFVERTRVLQLEKRSFSSSQYLNGSL
ncbi:hypothetical protein TNCT_401711 [Trichonephila clavata]|uniref:MATH domain-containing protein n=1 Tax=Trichonephila clavata TaxID=2740835 RepID=A0A8X6GBG9_TRICU|nr:hypothetical protein TNCT_401711 [Trichonephila clavata]